MYRVIIITYNDANHEFHGFYRLSFDKLPEVDEVLELGGSRIKYKISERIRYKPDWDDVTIYYANPLNN